VASVADMPTVASDPPSPGLPPISFKLKLERLKPAPRSGPALASRSRNVPQDGKSLLRQLVLLSRRSAAVFKGPYAALELQHQQPVVLASGPEGASLSIEMDLRRARSQVRRHPAARANMIGSGARRRCTGRIVVSDLLRPAWIANVEHTDYRS